jgi:SLT domain-containing protein
MKKVNGLYLSNSEVDILQKLIFHMFNSENNDNAANEIAKLAAAMELTDDKLGVGFAVLDFLRHKPSKDEM